MAVEMAVDMRFYLIVDIYRLDLQELWAHGPLPRSRAHRASFCCDLTTRGSTQAVAWSDPRRRDGPPPTIAYWISSSFCIALSGKTCAALASDRSDWAIQSYHRTLLGFCDETQHVSFRAAGRLAGCPAAPVCGRRPSRTVVPFAIPAERLAVRAARPPQWRLHEPEPGSDCREFGLDPYGCLGRRS